MIFCKLDQSYEMRKLLPKMSKYVCNQLMLINVLTRDEGVVVVDASVKSQVSFLFFVISQILQNLCTT